MSADGGLSDFIQAQRLLRIETTLGEDAFLIESFSGTERVNGLFEFTAVLRAKRDDLKPEEIIGKNVDVSVEIGEGQRRSWNALVVGLDEDPRLTRALRQYVLTLRPDLWLLSQRSDCRIWQRKTVLEVCETLMSEHGLRAPDARGVWSEPPAQEFSVQFNEDDLSYLLRRLEEDGIHYWIRQEKGGQTLVLSDSAAGWDAGADGGSGAERFASGSTDRNHLSAWQRKLRFGAARWARLELRNANNSAGRRDALDGEPAAQRLIRALRVSDTGAGSVRKRARDEAAYAGGGGRS